MTRWEGMKEEKRRGGVSTSERMGPSYGISHVAQLWAADRVGVFTSFLLHPHGFLTLLVSAFCHQNLITRAGIKSTRLVLPSLIFVIMLFQFLFFLTILY